MKEPKRWRDDPDASAELRDVLAQARPSRRMSAEEFARGSRRLATGAAAASSILLWLKGPALAAIIGVGVVAGAAAVVRHRQNDKPIEPMRVMVSAVAKHFQPPASEIAKISDFPVEPSAGVESPAGSAKRASEADSNASGPARDSLAEETELIDQARSLLSSNPSAALGVLDQHQKRFPRGKLGMERELLRVDALRRSGRTAEARSLVESLLARAKNSIYETRLRQQLEALGGTPKSE